MKKEIRISYDDSCAAAIKELEKVHPEIKGAKVEYIKKYSYEPEGRYDVFYERPDEVAFIVALPDKQ
jgi:lipocalin